jgi:hypothetical protein
MLLGKNTNVRHEGVVFHVQTEDSGVARPHVITHLYHQGTILASEKRSYAELVKRPDLEARVRALMDEQHERMLGKLRSGELDGLLGERLGGAFAKRAGAKRAPAPEMTPPSLRLEETLPEPPPDPILEAVLAVGRLEEPMQGPQAVGPAPLAAPARAPGKPQPAPSPAPRPAAPAAPSAQRPSPGPAPAPAATARPPGSVQRARPDSTREQTVPEPTPRTFGDGIITDKPLDEVILAYLVEKARHRKRLPT